MIKIKEEDLQLAIAQALWDGYEYSLPDTPGQLAKFVIYHMKKSGFTFTGGNNE
jgi:hypothetical protein